MPCASLYFGDRCSQPSTAKALHLGIQPTVFRENCISGGHVDCPLLLFLNNTGYHLHNVCTQSRVLSVTWRLYSSGGCRRTNTMFKHSSILSRETEALVGYGIHRESWNPSPTDTGGWRCKFLPLRRLESGRRKVGQMTRGPCCTRMKT